MNIIIGLLILSSIIAPIAIYKRSKSLKFSIVKTKILNVYYYSPQVRIDGIWFNIYNKKILGQSVFIISHDNFDAYLDVQDSLGAIENFKSAGNFTISSNRKLNSNEKQIIVE